MSKVRQPDKMDLPTWTWRGSLCHPRPTDGTTTRRCAQKPAPLWAGCSGPKYSGLENRTISSPYLNPVQISRWHSLFVFKLPPGPIFKHTHTHTKNNFTGKYLFHETLTGCPLPFNHQQMNSWPQRETVTAPVKAGRQTGLR